MTENMQWLIYGALVTTSVGFCTYFIQNCFKRCWDGVHSAIFQLISTRFDLAEVTLHDTGCEKVIARILWQIGLDTRRYVYIHDANMTSGDQMMVGIIRLPTKSWFLWCLALLEISHFIWIKDNVKTILYVGPRAGVDTLLDVANKTKNRSPRPAEIENIQTAFRGDNFTITACVYFERRIFGTILVFAIACLAQSSVDIPTLDGRVAYYTRITKRCNDAQHR